MSKVLLFVTCLALIYQLSEAKLSCLQCSNVIQPCLAKDASSVTCPSDKSLCLRQIRSTEDPKVESAIRKCIIPEVATNAYNCPPGSTCFTCGSNDCNAASSLKLSSVGLVGVVVALLASKFAIN